jgi:exonuclease SbcD
MKFLHTADWHLGIRLMHRDRGAEMALFLDWLFQVLNEEGIECLLISGDVFDSSNPSNAAMEMYYGFLARASQIPHLERIIITGGNHDSPSVLNAPAGLLKYLKVTVVGATTGNPSDELVVLNDKITGKPKAIVAAVPFLREKDLRKSIMGESIEARTQILIDNTLAHYRTLVTLAQEMQAGDIPLIGMGHLYTANADFSDSERNNQIGTLGHIPASGFPSEFSYLALGHIHKPQRVGGKEHIRYSGSPLAFSFSEVAVPKRVIVFDAITSTQVTEVKEIPTPIYSPLIRKTGTLQELQLWIESYSHNYPFPALVELNSTSIVSRDLLPENKDLEIVAIRRVTEQAANNAQVMEEDIANKLDNLTPEYVFGQVLAKSSIPMAEQALLTDAFNELLSRHYEGYQTENQAPNA